MEEIKNKTNLASNQENGKKEHGVFALIAAAVVLLFLGSFLWILIQKPNNNINSKPQPLTDKNSCQRDSDCALIPVYKDCCSLCGQEAVRKDKIQEVLRQRQNDSLCVLKKFACPAYRCPRYDYKAVCEQNKCVAKETLVVSNADINGNTSGNINASVNQYKIIGSYTSPGEASFIEKIGNTVFMTDITEGLLAIDVSDPKDPKLLSETKIGGAGAYALVKSQDNSYLLVSGYGNTKIALIDLVNSDKPNIVIASLDTKRSVQDMAIMGDYAYMAIDGPEIEILKIDRESFSPTISSKGIFQIAGGGHAIGIAVTEDVPGNIIAVAQGESGAAVYDFITPSAPKFKVGIHPTGFGSTVAVQGNLVYVGVGGEVKVAGISPQNLTEMGSVQAGSVWNIKIKDNLLYVASGEEGVKIFDVSDIGNPRLVAVIDTPGRARDLVIDGDYIYVADDANDLQIIGKR